MECLFSARPPEALDCGNPVAALGQATLSRPAFLYPSPRATGLPSGKAAAGRRSPRRLRRGNGEIDGYPEIDILHPSTNTLFANKIHMCFDPSTSKGLLSWSLLGALAITVVWFVSFFVVKGLFGTPDSPGTFGDSFGAINALFSGLAFLGVIVAIVLQRQELIEQRKEIRVSRVAKEESAKALQQTLEDAKIKTELESLNLLIQSYSTLVESTRLASSLADKKRHEQARQKLDEYQARLIERVNKVINTNEQSERSSKE